MLELRQKMLKSYQEELEGAEEQIALLSAYLGYLLAEKDKNVIPVSAVSEALGKYLFRVSSEDGNYVIERVLRDGQA